MVVSVELALGNKSIVLESDDGGSAGMLGWSRVRKAPALIVVEAGELARETLLS